MLENDGVDECFVVTKYSSYEYNSEYIEDNGKMWVGGIKDITINHFKYHHACVNLFEYEVCVYNLHITMINDDDEIVYEGFIQFNNLTMIRLLIKYLMNIIKDYPDTKLCINRKRYVIFENCLYRSIDNGFVIIKHYNDIVKK